MSKHHPQQTPAAPVTSGRDPIAKGDEQKGGHVAKPTTANIPDTGTIGTLDTAGNVPNALLETDHPETNFDRLNNAEADLQRRGQAEFQRRENSETVVEPREPPTPAEQKIVREAGADVPKADR